MNFQRSLDPKAMTIEGLPSASKGKSVTPALEYMTDCVLQGDPRRASALFPIQCALAETCHLPTRS